MFETLGDVSLSVLQSVERVRAATRADAQPKISFATMRMGAHTAAKMRPRMNAEKKTVAASLRLSRIIRLRS